MIKTQKVDEYQPKFNDNFFLDANIWLFLYCPVGDWNLAKQKKYAEFLKQCRSANSGIHINSLVLSEFCNRCFRIDFEMRKKDFPGLTLDYKKDYLPSEYYQETCSSVAAAIKQILQISNRISDDFNAIDLGSIFSNLRNIDFNDCYYAELVERKNWVLVTDDGDYIRSENEITVLSANSTYF